MLDEGCDVFIVIVVVVDYCVVEVVEYKIKKVGDEFNVFLIKNFDIVVIIV